ncbi:MAG: CHAP domain-containing protein [Clostridia bacterium]|nr:CHAP domain-containing protein [Clostridia bacterium]
MLHKKKITIKLIASLLCLLLILPTTSVTALEIVPETTIPDDETAILSEVLDVYFESRTFNSSIDIIEAIADITNPGMPEDEAKRMQAWQSAGILGITNSYTISSFHMGDEIGDVTVTEIVNYLYIDRTVTESVTHYLEYLCNKETDSVHILMDSYTEQEINFTSRSYLPEYTMVVYNTNTTYGNATATNNHVNTGNFAYDVTQIALTQIGYVEKNDASDLDSKVGETAGDGNWTKYNRDIGYNGKAMWCASFIAWCAQEAELCIGKDNTSQTPANYDGTIIPNEKSVSDMANYYKNDNEDLNRFYTSSSYTPQIGDIFYMQGDGDSHVGLVVEVTSSQVRVVHGNSSNQVKYSTYAISGSSITGYASPNYDQYATADASHDYNHDNTHDHDASLVHTCYRCDKVTTATWVGNHPTTTDHTCSACGYVQSGSFTENIEYAHNASSHWLTCTVCNATWNNGAHFWIPINNGNDGYNCRTCGRYTFAITINKLLPLIQSKE